MTSTREGRIKRHRRIRRKIQGTAERPRLSVRRTGRHLYAQIVDDIAGHTLAFLTTNRKEFKTEGNNWSNVKSAQKLGVALGEIARSKGIERVVFDRGGLRYHGVVKTVADAARESGLEF
jgi:large subunit ribosomal protein L18